MKLEHVNLRVPSIARTQEFLAAAFADFRQRGSGFSQTYGYWSHFGNDDTYIALLQADEPGQEPGQPVPDFHYGDSYRLMHVGLVVDDLEALMARLTSRGIAASDLGSLDEHPHRRRAYYRDGNGVEWEFVQYLSDDPAQRNDYEL